MPLPSILFAFCSENLLASCTEPLMIPEMAKSLPTGMPQCVFSLGAARPWSHRVRDVLPVIILLALAIEICSYSLDVGAWGVTSRA